MVVLTGQHEALLDPLIALFGLERRMDLGARIAGDTLTSFAARCLDRLAQCYADERFEAVVVQGDTTSALAGALAAAYAGIPVAHVEAGLRSGDLANPFPEEMNRRMIADTAHWHFAPTALAAENLRREGRSGHVHLVGTSVVDSALWVAERRETRALVLERFPMLGERPHLFVTAHRRESFGRPMSDIGEAIAQIAALEPGTELMTEPLSYPLAIGLIATAAMILTDSGGLQEEAPSFGVPVLVLREVTERPEGIEAGCSRMAGTSSVAIVDAFERWRADGERCGAANPYGDGRSGERIADILLGSLAGLREAC